MHFFNDKKINYLIFDNILTLFPKFADAFCGVKGEFSKERFVVGEFGDYDLNITAISYSKEKECYLVSLFTEIEINNKLIKYPELLLGFDLANKRAEVLKYRSESYPFTTLSVYNAHNGRVYENIIAHKDLSLFCCRWLKKYIEQEHSLVWKNIKTA